MNTEMESLSKQLQDELVFWEQGGYSRALGSSWRTPLIFEDSKICARNQHLHQHQSCASCALIQLVPPEHRRDKTPCRHIPLNAEGETLDSLYRYADEHEIELAFGNWLRSTIERMEKQQEVESKIGASSGEHEGKGKLTPRGCRERCAHSNCQTRQFGSEPSAAGSCRVGIPGTARRKAFPS